MIRVRQDESANYKAVFFNGKTIRQRIDVTKPITEPEYPELLDIAINNLCKANCPYCYVSATKSGYNFDNIVQKFVEIFEPLSPNQRVFQTAIGGAGEPTLHPDFIPFLKAHVDLGITPNYTTNGMHITPEILEATENYCGGVAVSLHPHIEKVFHKAMEAYSTINTKLNAHIIVGQEGSLNKLQEVYDKYSDVLDYIVVLPYQKAGRATKVDNVEDVWRETFEWISSTGDRRFAFGALFFDYLKDNNTPVKLNIYEPEIYSGYLIMDDSYRKIRKSSYDNSIKKIL